MSVVNGANDGPPDPNGSAASTILLVEDEQAILALASRILRRRGYTVLEAGTGADAVRLAAEHDGVINLLLTDLIMPELGGADVAREITLVQPTMQVIFMSGYGEEDLAKHGVSGPAFFIGKPFTPDGLVAKVQQALA